MAYNSTHTGAAIDSAITKAQSVESGATANATDAQLRDRSTHTGTQDAATITGLASVAVSGGYGDLTGVPGSFPPSAHTHTLSQITNAGSAAAQDVSAFATAAQGATADTALQTGANVSELANDAQFVVSNPVGITGASRVVNHVFMSQAAYDALGSYDANTVYEIVS